MVGVAGRDVEGVMEGVRVGEGAGVFVGVGVLVLDGVVVGVLVGVVVGVLTGVPEGRIGVMGIIPGLWLHVINILTPY